VALGSIHFLTEMNTMGVQATGARADNLITFMCLEVWDPHPPGTVMARPGLYTDYFTFTFFIYMHTDVYTIYVRVDSILRVLTW
jgi:hypothetical protein